MYSIYPTVLLRYWNTSEREMTTGYIRGTSHLLQI